MTNILINAGCGPRGSGGVPGYFSSWRQLRVDIDLSVEPDVVADITDLSPIESGSADAIWSSHCLEHLFIHQVGTALREFHRVLNDDGFACFLVPDIQAVAQHIAADRMHEVIYQSAAGPITPHDMVYGFGLAIEHGRTFMAHRCGFTPGMLVHQLSQTPFASNVVRRLPTLELMVVAKKTPWANDGERQALLQSLGR